MCALDISADSLYGELVERMLMRCGKTQAYVAKRLRRPSNYLTRVRKGRVGPMKPYWQDKYIEITEEHDANIIAAFKLRGTIERRWSKDYRAQQYGLAMAERRRLHEVDVRSIHDMVADLRLCRAELEKLLPLIDTVVVEFRKQLRLLVGAVEIVQRRAAIRKEVTSDLR